jgi:hypothetical protein
MPQNFRDFQTSKSKVNPGDKLKGKLSAQSSGKKIRI